MENKIESLGDMFIEFGNRLNEYQVNANVEKLKDNKEQLYTVKDIEKIYPMLSKYHLTKAIKDGELPVTYVGHKRFFYLKDIDAFLEKNTLRELRPNSVTSWRKHA